MPVLMLPCDKASVLEPLDRPTPEIEGMPALFSAIRKQLMLDGSKTEVQVDKRMDDFNGVVNHIARSLNTKPDRLTVSNIVQNETAFLDYVSLKKLSPRTKVQLPSNRRALLRHARILGFSPHSFAILEEWEPIEAALPPICRIIINHAMRRNRRPIDFSNSDLAMWANMTVDAGRQYVYVRNMQTAFLTAIRESGLHTRLPQLDVVTRRLPAFSIRMDHMPLALSGEIGEIIESRKDKAKLGLIRSTPRTESEIIDHFEELIGYAIRIREMENVSSLRPLLIESFMMDFAFWLRDERKCSRATVVGRLSRMVSTIECSPAFRGHDLSWVDKIFINLIKEPESALKGRRRKRFIAFRKLAVVPERMRIERTTRSHVSPTSLALRIRDELLLSFLILAQYPPISLEKRFWRKTCLRPPFHVPIQSSKFRTGCTNLSRKIRAQLSGSSTMSPDKGKYFADWSCGRLRLYWICTSLFTGLCWLVQTWILELCSSLDPWPPTLPTSSDNM